MSCYLSDTSITKHLTQAQTTFFLINNLFLNRTIFTFFKRFVINTFPNQFIFPDQSADGKIPASRHFITTVTGLLPSEIFDSEVSVLLYHSNSITWFLSCYNDKTIHMQKVIILISTMHRGFDFYLSNSLVTEKIEY